MRFGQINWWGRGRKGAVVEEGGRLGRKVGGWGGRWEVREEGGRYGRKGQRWRVGQSTIILSNCVQKRRNCVWTMEGGGGRAISAKNCVQLCGKIERWIICLLKLGWRRRRHRRFSRPFRLPKTTKTTKTAKASTMTNKATKGKTVLDRSDRSDRLDR